MDMDNENKIQAVVNGLSQIDLSLEENLPQLEEEVKNLQLSLKNQDFGPSENVKVLTLKVQAGVKTLSTKLPVLIEEYFGQINQVSKLASSLKEIMTPAASGNPTGDANKEDEAVNLLVEMSKLSQAVLDSQLANLGFFKTAIYKESETLVNDIEKLADEQLSVKEIHEKLTRVIDLPNTQKSKINNLADSVQEEITQIEGYCSVLNEVLA